MNNSTSAFSSIGGLKSASIISSEVLLVVDLMPFLFRFICPFTVAVDSGKYLRTCLDVIGGNPISWSLSMALQKVSTVGENIYWWINCMVSASVEVW